MDLAYLTFLLIYIVLVAQVFINVLRAILINAYATMKLRVKTSKIEGNFLVDIFFICMYYPVKSRR